MVRFAIVSVSAACAVGCETTPPLSASQYMNLVAPNSMRMELARIEPVGLRTAGRLVAVDIVVTASSQECALSVASNIIAILEQEPAQYLRIVTQDGAGVALAPDVRFEYYKDSPHIRYSPGYRPQDYWQRDSAGNVRVLVPVHLMMRVARDAAYEVQVLQELQERFTQLELARCPVEIASTPRLVRVSDDVVNPMPVVLLPGTMPAP